MKKRAGWLLGAILVLAFLVRAWGIGRVGLWHDEAVSHAYALQSVPWIFEHCAGFINHPPLFFLLLHAWLSVVPPFNQWAVESLNLVFALFALLFFYRWSRLHFSTTRTLLLTLFLSLHGFHVYYSTELRMYCLAVLGVTAFGYYTARHFDESRSGRWAWAGWVISALIALYAHSFAGMFVALGMVATGWMSYRVGTFRRWSVSTLLVGMLYGPWFVFVLQQTSRITSSFWIPPFQWEYLLVLGYWLGGFVTTKSPGTVTLVKSLLVCVGFIAPLLWSLKRISSARIRVYWILLVAPVLIVTLLSLRGSQSVFMYRPFLFALPFALMLVGVGLRVLPDRVAAVVALVFLLSLGWNLYDLKSNPPHRYAPGVARWVEQETPPDGRVLHAWRFTYFPSLFYHRHRLREHLYGNDKVSGITVDARDVRSWRKNGPVMLVYPENLRESPLERTTLDRWKDNGHKRGTKRWGSREFHLLLLPQTQP